ncbi:MAG: TonB family protein [Bryobacteraceae bacterium]
MTNSGITAESIGAPAPVSASFRWEVPEKPPSILVSLDVIDRLERQVLEAFKAITSRGSEIGGLLLGRIVTGGKRTVFIEDYVPVDCEYSRGPLYLLADADKQRLEEAIANAKSSATLSLVGFFRSNTRKDIALDEDDLGLANDYFPDPNHVLLVVKPMSMRPSTAGFFIWEDGSIRGEESYAPFPFKRAELMKAFADAIVPAGGAKSAAGPSETPAPPVVMPIREERPAPQPISFKREEPAVAPPPAAPPRPSPVFYKREEAKPAAPPVTPPPPVRPEPVPPRPSLSSFGREEVKPAAPPVTPPPPMRPEPVPPRPSPLSFRREEAKPAAPPVAPPPPVRPEPVPPRPSPLSFRREESKPAAPPVAPPPPVRPEPPAPPRVAPVSFKREEPRPPAPPAAPPVEVKQERPPAPPLSFRREERPPAPPPPPVVKREQPVAPPKREEEPAVAPVTAKREEKPAIIPIPQKAAEPAKKEERQAVQPIVAKKEEPVVAKREERPAVQPVQPATQKREAPAAQPTPARKQEQPAAAAAPAVKVAMAPAPSIGSGSLFADAAPEPSGFGMKKILLIAAGVVALCVGGYFAFSNHPSSTPVAVSAPEVVSGLGLKVDKNGTSGGQLLLTWKRDSDFITTARSATLTIQDGDRKEPVSLDLAQLRFGSIAYTPDSNDVSFRLEVIGKTKTLSESMRYLTGRPSAAGPITASGAGSKAGPERPQQTNVPVTSANSTGVSVVDAPKQLPPTQVTAQPALPGTLASNLAPAPPPSIVPPSFGNGSSSTISQTYVIPSGKGDALPGEPKAPPVVHSAQPVRVSAGIQETKVLRRVAPVFPAAARAARLSGLVKLEAVIGKDGRVKTVSVKSGSPLLRQAATEAVQRWVYQPTVYNGQPIEVVTDIDVNFNFNR